MVEIDAWAKQHDLELYDNSNKPYLMAMMVQQEIDEAKAKESARPATVVEVQEPEAVSSEEWVDNLTSYAIGGVFALILFQILRPSARSQGPKARGMSCVAWAVATTTFLGFPVSISTCVLFACVFAPIAFVMGWIYESIWGKSRSSGDQPVSTQPASKLSPKEIVYDFADVLGQLNLPILDARMLPHPKADIYSAFKTYMAQLKVSAEYSEESRQELERVDMLYLMISDFQEIDPEDRKLLNEVNGGQRFAKFRAQEELASGFASKQEEADFVTFSNLVSKYESRSNKELGIL